MEKILVGLSGGVDSAVTVYLLKKQGYQVIGAFLDMLGGGEEFERAEILAKQLDIELIKENIGKIFQKEIINKFIDNYKNGFTPNPCVVCNPMIKFKYLLKAADNLGIKKVATGHYAKVIENAAGEKSLVRANDNAKDQSYFLYRLTQDELERVELPLGELLKTDVKKIAKEINLKVPKSESQDVCFLKNYKNLEEFLQKSVDKKDFSKGAIVSKEGQVLGEHKGLLVYTFGQRKGLDIGGDGPFYVIGKDFKRNELIVSRDKQDEKLLKDEIIINDVNWISKNPVRNKIYQIQIRYQMKPVEAKLKEDVDGQWVAKCANPIWAVTPGQSLVIYDGVKVIGGGTISEN